jgi:ribosomal protein S18 acetylase RimI-like enzyme
MDASQVELRVGAEIPLADLIGLYDSVGWKAYTVSERRPDLPRALRNSTYVVTAWYGERLIGLARALSDDVSVFYLQDLLVLPGYQGQGIGSQLLRNCLERYGHVRMHVLLADDDERARRFYESFGFRNIRDVSETPLNAFVRVHGVQLS